MFLNVPCDNPIPLHHPINVAPPDAQNKLTPSKRPQRRPSWPRRPLAPLWTPACRKWRGQRGPLRPGPPWGRGGAPFFGAGTRGPQDGPASPVRGPWWPSPSRGTGSGTCTAGEKGGGVSKSFYFRSYYLHSQKKLFIMTENINTLWKWMEKLNLLNQMYTAQLFFFFFFFFFAISAVGTARRDKELHETYSVQPIPPSMQ